MMGYGWAFGLGGWLMMIGWIVIVVAVIAVVAWLVSRAAPATQPQLPNATPGANPDALELLKMRFARGEISQDEYVAARQVLEDRR